MTNGHKSLAFSSHLLVYFLLYFQVEYAIEAINNAGTCVGILAKDGIVMASERRITSGLLAPAKVNTQKIAHLLQVIIFYFCLVLLMDSFFASSVDLGKDLHSVPSRLV